MIRGVTALLLAAFIFSTSPAEARHRHHHKHYRVTHSVDANGNAGIVVSHKTGAKARVGVQYAAQFQAYIDDLETVGATVLFIGGVRRGHCSIAHLHPCGRALDVCQLARGRVDGRCHLPARGEIAMIAARHGLFEGGQWCNSDYGHAQVGVSAPACNAVALARHHHRHTREARAF